MGYCATSSKASRRPYRRQKAGHSSSKMNSDYGMECCHRCGGTPTLSRGAFLTTRWLHDPATMNQRVGFGFSHLRWPYQPGRTPFSPPGCWGSRFIDGFYDPVIEPVSSSGAARPRRCPREKFWPRDGSMRPSSINDQSTGVGFSTLAGQYRSGGCLFSPSAC